MPAIAVRSIYGLVADPSEPSVAAETFAAAFAQVARASAYVPFPVAPEKLEAAFAGARALGVAGFHVGPGYRQRAAKLVDQLEGDAAALRTVNVVVQEDGRLVGHNTDTAAVTQALEKVRFDLRGKRALVLGAGSSGRSAALALARAGAGEVIVANRTFQKARDLCELLATAGVEALAAPLSAAAMRELVPMSRVVVNATSLGRSPEENPLPPGAQFEPETLYLELVDRPLKTRLVKAAHEQGANVVDGLELHVQQALASLAIFLKRPVDAARLAPVMRSAALEALL